MAEKNDRKKRATAAAVAAMTAGSVVVGGLFTDPDDLLTNDAPAPHLFIGHHARFRVPFHQVL